MTSRTYTCDQLEAIGVPYDCASSVAPVEGYATELHCEQIDTRRWLSVHELIFRAPDDGKAYRVTYDRGLTENQWCSPFEYRGNTIEAVEVEQRTRTVEITEWHAVGQPTEDAQQPNPTP
jgi:hypothetical protein